MNTTVMRDSVVGDAWIQETCRLNPVQRVIDPKTGLPNGNILTGPVRLTFCETLLIKGKLMKTDPKSKEGHATNALFTPYTDLAIFWEEYWKICASDFANLYDTGTAQYYGIDNPVREQAEKVKFGGYTPGLKYITCTSQFKPAVVDARMNPIVDPARVYAGVWAILAVNGYASGKNQPKKGPRFGLQSVMIIGDDTPLGGQAADPKQQFASANVKPPIAAPAAAFGQSAPPPPPGVGGIAAFYPPTGAPPPMPSQGSYPPPPPPLASEEDLSQFA